MARYHAENCRLISKNVCHDKITFESRKTRLTKWRYASKKRNSISKYYVLLPSLEVNREFFSFLISNAPKLKSPQLYGSECPVSDQLIYNFCKSLKIVGSFNTSNFEEFLNHHILHNFPHLNHQNNPDYHHHIFS